MLKVMLHDALSLLNVMNNLHASRSGIKYIFICSQKGDTVSRSGSTPQLSQDPERESQTTRKKSLISNLNNFFLDSLKKSERSKVWKFIHL